MTTHVRRYLKHYGQRGHVGQGGFQAFPIQDDAHLITVVCYVERNPLRGGLVPRAENWPSSSLGTAGTALESVPMIAADPLLRRGDGAEFVNAPQTEAEAAAIPLSIRHDRPYGSES